MGIEIERKFLVDPTKFPDDFVVDKCSLIQQGYLGSLTADAQIRVRVKTEKFSDKAYLTVKSKSTGKFTRSEYEYEIPLGDALDMMSMINGKLITKLRLHCGRWIVDRYQEPHAGLWIAEIELESEDEMIEIPEWIEKEVTGDTRYSNISLSQA